MTFSCAELWEENDFDKSRPTSPDLMFPNHSSIDEDVDEHGFPKNGAMYQFDSPVVMKDIVSTATKLNPSVKGFINLAVMGQQLRNSQQSGEKEEPLEPEKEKTPTVSPEKEKISEALREALEWLNNCQNSKKKKKITFNVDFNS